MHKIIAWITRNKQKVIVLGVGIALLLTLSSSPRYMRDSDEVYLLKTTISHQNKVINRCLFILVVGGILFYFSKEKD